MFRAFCSLFPFIVCLCWFITFVLHTRRNDSAKRVLTVFLGICSVLYLCHAFYFNGGLQVWGEALWVLCSLSVYPLYFIYITHLTCRPLSRWEMVLCLLPGVAVAGARLLYPAAPIDTVRQLLFTVQVFSVLYFGYRRLHVFDQEVANVYADTEGRDTSAMKSLLVAFVAMSILSAIANVIGKQHVAASGWLWVGLLPFGILLYALSFMGYMRDFSPEQFIEDTDETVPEVADTDEEMEAIGDNDLGKKIEELMAANYFLTKNLKVMDLAREVGSCRTYVSKYINQAYDQSFSDYVNSLRVEYSKQLLHGDKDMKMSIVSDKSGFSCEQSFYRNFKKFVGMSPAEWIEQQEE